MAKKIGGDNHGFKFIQLPFNLYYDQALLGKTQTIDDNPVSCLRICNKIGVELFLLSVPLMQGRLLQPGVMH